MDRHPDIPEEHGAQDAQLSTAKRGLLALRDLQRRLEASERGRREPIAIIGIGCRFPGSASSPAAFWRLLESGTDAISEVPANRWPVADANDPDAQAAGISTTRWGGFLQDVDQFDPYFFGIAPREAATMDPQQRILMEVAWEALEEPDRRSTAERAHRRVRGRLQQRLPAVKRRSGHQPVHRHWYGPLDHCLPTLVLPQSSRAERGGGHRVLLIAGGGASRLSEPPHS